MTAQRLGPKDHALACLLAYNGLRASECCSVMIQGLAVERGHRTLVVARKGGKRQTIPLIPRVARSLDLVIGERADGPILITGMGTAWDRMEVYRRVKKICRHAGLPAAIHPHSLRHSSITAALDAGVPLRDVQEFAAHADPRTTGRYDRNRVSLDRHASYILGPYLAGG
jgi:integrase